MDGPRQLIDRVSAFLFARARLAAPLLGMIAACGFEPLHWWPLTLLGLAGLVGLIAAAPTLRRAALLGWLWGVGHFCLGNNWIATAFTYQAAMPEWLGWIAVFALSLFLAIYPALAAAVAWRFRASPAALVPAFAASWIISEWLRSWLFSGFAWNPLGVVLLGGFDGQGLAMLARWTGTYGLSGVAALIGGAVWAAATQWQRPSAKVLALLIACALSPMLVTGRIAPPVGTLAYTLIQPGIPQQDIDNPAKFEEQFARTARLTAPREPGQRRLVLWPESGIPDYLREGYPRYFYEENTYAADPRVARARIARVVGPGSALLTGTVDLDIRREQVLGARNVVSVIDDAGAIRASYAKAHLVPYGEYLPMRPLLEPMGLSRLVPGSIDFQPGPGPRTLQLGPWGKAAIQICYEIVFSGQVVDAAHRPSYIFNPSNDGWFGAWGPPQHLAQARLRAVEEGLPVLRATTNGISAVIDADGIVRGHLPRDIAGRLDGMVPPAHLPTLFARTGNMLPLALAAILLVLSLVAMRRRQG
ncbi:MAG: apolipoprotein N-acyltransferase [Novosphingobium sp.]